MDSMISLNTSLPRPNATRPPPPEQLLQAFKTAALSVTNLYKNAVTDQSSNRQAGYQDALDDLLVFLDRENLGLQDGEGWRIRQWATERFERAVAGTQTGDSDDDRGDTEKRARSSSPAINQKASGDTAEEPEDTRDISPIRTEVAPPPSQTSQDPDTSARSPIFTFTAAQLSNPQDTDMQSSETAPAEHQVATGAEPTSSESPAVRVEVINRGLRTPHRHGFSRHNTRSIHRDFTLAAGTKRKLQFPDFFDISNLNNGKDASGGGKRGRFN